MTSYEKLINILKNEPAVSRGGQRLGPWEKGDKNPPWGWGCVTIGFFLLLKMPNLTVLLYNVEDYQLLHSIQPIACSCSSNEKDKALIL